MKKLTALLLACALLIGALPLLAPAAAADEPVFTISGLNVGAKVGDVSVTLPQGAPYVLDTMDFTEGFYADNPVDKNEAISAGKQYYIRLCFSATDGTDLTTLINDATVAPVIAGIDTLYKGIYISEPNRVCMRLTYEPGTIAYSAAPLQVASEVIRPTVGVPLATSDVILSQLTLANAEGLDSIELRWFVNNDMGEFINTGYVPKNNDVVQLRLRLKWKNGYGYGLKDSDMTDAAIRSWFKNDPFIQLADGLSFMDEEYKVSDIEVRYAAAPQNGSPAPIQPGQTVTVLTIGSNVMERVVNGTTSTVTMDVAPYINPGEGRTMLPLRAVGEILGLNVEWSDATRTVTVTGDGVNASVPIFADAITVNGKAIPVDVSAEIRDGRTMVSIANLGTALGLERDKNIIWDAASRTVTIRV